MNLGKEGLLPKRIIKQCQHSAIQTTLPLNLHYLARLPANSYAANQHNELTVIHKLHNQHGLLLLRNHCAHYRGNARMPQFAQIPHLVNEIRLELGVLILLEGAGHDAESGYSLCFYCWDDARCHSGSISSAGISPAVISPLFCRKLPQIARVETIP